MVAAKIAQACSDIGTAALKERWSQLAEVHAAPSWLWPALAAELVARVGESQTCMNAATVARPLNPPYVGRMLAAPRARTVQERGTPELVAAVERARGRTQG